MIYIDTDGFVDDRVRAKMSAVMGKAVWQTIGGEAVIELTIVDEEEIQRLNREFRDIDKVTDVLSFPANDLSEPLTKETAAAEDIEKDEETKQPVLGDIAICFERAKEQAEEYGNTLEEELCFLAVHGTLHLLGYDHIDPDDEVLMREKQREALGRKDRSEQE